MLLLLAGLYSVSQDLLEKCKKKSQISEGRLSCEWYDLSLFRKSNKWNTLPSFLTVLRHGGDNIVQAADKAPSNRLCFKH